MTETICVSLTDFKLPACLPSLCSDIYEKNIRKQSRHIAFLFVFLPCSPPMANSTRICKSAAQGLPETEGSKRLLYLVDINRPSYHQFHLIIFKDYLYFQTSEVSILGHSLLLLISEIGKIPCSPSYLSRNDILQVYLLLPACFSAWSALFYIHFWFWLSNLGSYVKAVLYFYHPSLPLLYIFKDRVPCYSYMGTMFLIVSNIWLYLFFCFPPTAGVFGEKPPEITVTPGSFLGEKGLTWLVRANRKLIIALAYFNSGMLPYTYQYGILLMFMTQPFPLGQESPLQFLGALFWLSWLLLPQPMQAAAPSGCPLSQPTRWLCPTAPALSHLSNNSSYSPLCGVTAHPLSCSLPL